MIRFVKPRFIALLLLASLLSSCCCRYCFSGGRHREKDFLYGTFKFAQRPDIVYLKPSFITYMKANPSCNVVLRVPASSSVVADEEKFQNRSGYFAFEKTLLENNFKVSDRALFEKSFEKDGAQKTQTDLIIEMVDYQVVSYYTNKVTPRNNPGIEVKTKRPYYFQGARAEFKIVHIQSNEVVATFILNYTPCTKGCLVRYTKDGYVEEIEDDGRFVAAGGFESVVLDRNEHMFTELATRVVNELRKSRE